MSSPSIVLGPSSSGTTILLRFSVTLTDTEGIPSIYTVDITPTITSTFNYNFVPGNSYKIIYNTSNNPVEMQLYSDNLWISYFRTNTSFLPITINGGTTTTTPLFLETNTYDVTVSYNRVTSGTLVTSNIRTFTWVLPTSPQVFFPVENTIYGRNLPISVSWAVFTANTSKMIRWFDHITKNLICQTNFNVYNSNFSIYFGMNATNNSTVISDPNYLDIAYTSTSYGSASSTGTIYLLSNPYIIDVKNITTGITATTTITSETNTYITYSNTYQSDGFITTILRGLTSRQTSNSYQPFLSTTLTSIPDGVYDIVFSTVSQLTLSYTSTVIPKVTIRTSISPVSFTPANDSIITNRNQLVVVFTPTFTPTSFDILFNSASFSSLSGLIPSSNGQYSWDFTTNNTIANGVYTVQLRWTDTVGNVSSYQSNDIGVLIDPVFDQIGNFYTPEDSTFTITFYSFARNLLNPAIEFRRYPSNTLVTTYLISPLPTVTETEGAYTMTVIVPEANIPTNGMYRSTFRYYDTAAFATFTTVSSPYEISSLFWITYPLSNTSILSTSALFFGYLTPEIKTGTQIDLTITNIDTELSTNYSPTGSIAGITYLYPIPSADVPQGYYSFTLSFTDPLDTIRTVSVDNVVINTSGGGGGSVYPTLEYPRENGEILTARELFVIFNVPEISSSSDFKIKTISTYLGTGTTYSPTGIISNTSYQYFLDKNLTVNDTYYFEAVWTDISGDVNSYTVNNVKVNIVENYKNFEIYKTIANNTIRF